MSKQSKKKADEEGVKIITRYERRTQRRKAEALKERRQQKIAVATGLAILVAIVALVLSFPIRSYIAKTRAFIYVNGEKITRQEFDFQYYFTINSYASYLSMLGVDVSQDLSKQYYTDTMTWQDLFQEMALDTLKQTKALLVQADAEGFQHDTTAEFEQYKIDVQAQADALGMTLDSFITSSYGSYATLENIESFVKENIIFSAYYQKLTEEKAPTDEEILAYYEANIDEYDLVDYRIIEVAAVLPTEPTQTTASTETPDDGAATDDPDAAYEPTQEEIDAAMVIAKKEADASLATVTTEGTQHVNQRKSSISSFYNEWLFEAERNPADTTVIEDTANHKYYVLCFEKRYLDETPTRDARIILATAGQGQALLDSWNSNTPTAESFAALFEQSSSNASTSGGTGGLVEGITATAYDASVTAWLFDSARVAGDTTVISLESGTDYVLYYVGTNNPAWMLEIENTLLSETMSAYLAELTNTVTVEDPYGNLPFLELNAPASTDSQSIAETAETTQSTSTQE